MPAFDLDRFVAAQAEMYPRALAELRAGEKRSHWMWFVFPQLAGLGRGPTAHYYAIASAQEARAYLAHALPGPRLRECTAAILAHQDKSAERIFGSIDTMKLKSSMTLFEAVAGDPAPFAAVLDHFFGGGRDAATLDLLRG
jgi:uncharacterized protein (DUF1810 family)